MLIIENDAMGRRSDFALDRAANRLLKSLVPKGEVSDLVADYGHLVVDEMPPFVRGQFRGRRSRCKSQICARTIGNGASECLLDG
jgi:hypothetical protein